MSESNGKSGLTGAAIVLSLVALAGGGALALLAVSKGWIHMGAKRNTKSIMQAPGDPPIIIGDGSLHVHSKYDWATDIDTSTHMKIQPNGSTFQTNCSVTDEDGNPMAASVYLWTDDDDVYDISPASTAPNSPWKVTITHNKGPNGPINVTAFINASGVLEFDTDAGDFEPDAGYDDHDRHLKPPASGTGSGAESDVVTSIKVTGTTVTGNSLGGGGKWAAKSDHHPHYTVGFCYK